MTDDVVDAAAGLAPDSAVALLRRQREAFLRHTQGSHDVLIAPADPAGVSLTERAAAALRVASLEGDAALTAHYRARLRAVGGEVEAVSVPPRLDAILRHVELIATTPGEATLGDLQALRDAGLASRDIVTVAQIVAFVSYQVRVVAGLRALCAGGIPMSRGRFTLDAVEWAAWLQPVDAATATPRQAAALDASPQRDSAYFLTLAHDVDALEQRSPLFHAVMYAPRGLPRADRELATVVVSIINGCVYCSSVHARRFAELTKRPEVIQRLYDEGLGAQLEPRQRAIVDFAAKLTRRPQEVAPADLEPLRAVGMDDLQILDLIHAVAMFANANRLMQTLGEPVV